jgi:hypothetical protein
VFSGFWSFLLAIYWGIAGVLLLLALLRPKHWLSRVVGASIVIAVFGTYPAKLKYDEWRFRQYRDAAAAHFQKRCSENAGEHISRVIERVDGLFIAKPRIRADENSLRDQFWMGDPYGYSDYEADHPADTYLYDRSGETITSKRITPIKGFKFVEMANPAYSPGSSTAKYLRYSLKVVAAREGDNIVTRPRPVPEAVDTLKSRFAITWADISTREDREFWIAGGSLKIIDLRTNETVAERIGYVVDPYLGRSRHGRVIWLHVNHVPGVFCPAFETDFHKNKEFIAKVLHSSRGDGDGK